MILCASCLALAAMSACDNGSGTGTNMPGSGPPVGTAGVNLGTPSVHIAATDQLVFSPATQTVGVGQIVEWTNTGTVVHTITFDAYPYLSDPTLAPGGTWEVRFTKAGTYPYHCTIHAGMTGTLTVTAS